jgi:ribosomal protein L9
MAEAVLLKDVEGLGGAGDAVDVSPGYLRNFLVPRKLAQPPTLSSVRPAATRRRGRREDGRARRRDRQLSGRRSDDQPPGRWERQALRLGHLGRNREAIQAPAG